MQDQSITRSILMGEFPLSFHGIESFFQQGERLRFFEGEVLDSALIEKKFLFYVQSGKMAYEICRPDQTTFRFLTMAAGVTIFANAITPYTKYSQSWNSIALENTEIIAFDRDVIEQLLRKDAVLAAAFLDFTSEYHTIMQKRTLLTANLSSSQRVLTWLFALCNCEPQRQEEYSIPCSLSQQEIADILILHISTCNKMFGWLEANGVIEREKDAIHIYFPALQKSIAEDWKIY